MLLLTPIYGHTDKISGRCSSQLHQLRPLISRYLSSHCPRPLRHRPSSLRHRTFRGSGADDVRQASHRPSGLHDNNHVFIVAAIDMKVGGGVAMLTLDLLFESRIFPAIFTLSIRGLGRHTNRGSSWVIASLSGGALFPLLTGPLVDRRGYHISMAVFVDFSLRSHIRFTCILSVERSLMALDRRILGTWMVEFVGDSDRE
jgi:hypothetical protein